MTVVTVAIPKLTYKPGGAGVVVDLDRLIWSKLEIQAGSGYGKSWAVRQLCEETFGRVPQIVLDPEGEFHTLRERFDYVLAAPRGGDVEATPKTAAVLARRLVELRASAVIDLSEAKPGEQKRFVRLFLEAMVALPRDLWHPTLVVLDEIQLFAPEKGHGEAESLDAVADFGARGRKRGFCLVGATQRLSKFHKDVAASLHNKLIGFASLDLDIDRAAKELGFDKEHRATIGRLDPGQFYAYGPAIGKDVTLVETGKILTTHPKAGATVAVSAFPASKNVKKLIESSLADLPKEAEDEARTLDDYKKQVAQLRAELTRAQRAGVVAAAAPTIDQAAIDRAVRRAVDTYRAEQVKYVSRLALAFDQSTKMTNEAQLKVAAAVANLTSWSITPPTNGNGHVEQKRPQIQEIAKSTKSPILRHATGGGTIAKGERAVLIAIAQNPGGVTREQLTILTGYKRSTRDAYLQRLFAAGLAAMGSDGIVATDEGIAELGSDYEPLPTGSKLAEYWVRRLTGGERDMLAMLIDDGGAVSRDELGESTGYKRSTRDAYLQRLQARKLVESVGRGDVRASRMLFDGGM